MVNSSMCSCGTQLESLAEEYYYSRNEDIFNNVVKAGEPLVKHFALLLSGGRFIDDYMQAGFEGLIKAIKNYDASYNNTFLTYAGHLIIGEIRHYKRREALYYKPICINELQKKADELVEEYFTRTGEIPKVDYLSQKLNVKSEGIEQAMRAGTVSLDELDLAKISHIRYESFQLPIEDRITLEQAIKALTAVQRKVIYLLFYRDLTQEKVAKRLGTNQRKVSRILHGSLDRLRKELS